MLPLPLWILALLATVTCVSCGTVWPQPASQAPTKAHTQIDASAFRFFSRDTPSLILSEAFDRYDDLIFARASVSEGEGPERTSDLSLLELEVILRSEAEALTYETSEAYTLEVAAPKATVTADTVFGALRGLETFSQLVDAHQAPGGEVSYSVPVTKIVDAPRFQHRGLMLDTSRHFLPVRTLLRTLDAMAWVKLNVFHWHIVDDNSFPMQSSTFPALSRLGAWSSKHIYTKADVARVVEFGRRRGIRVMVEIDTPGHVASWGKSHPEVLTECFDKSGAPAGYGPLNPSRNSTYAFLSALFSEVAEAFPDQYMHVGGDEVPFECWASNPEVRAWMQAEGIETYEKVEEAFELKLLEITAAVGKSYVCWQEVFDNGVQLLPDTVVHAWKGYALSYR
mmetsp:Transcript_13712/g.43349  ORF Transcript_13712/g.43349 Transcript_13712/m.43349 type:complete len:396 (+) Transcript_13712:162-1349(+)